MKTVWTFPKLPLKSKVAHFSSRSEFLLRAGLFLDFYDMQGQDGYIPCLKGINLPTPDPFIIILQMRTVDASTHVIYHKINIIWLFFFRFFLVTCPPNWGY